MNNQEKEFNQAAETLKGASLTASEKNAMLKSIYDTVADVGMETTSSIPSPFIYSYFFKRRTLVALTGVFLMTATTSYASLASLGSLPGDHLYAMKVGIIEPIGLAVRFNEDERNAYRVTLLKERVAEIERLKEEGKLMSHTEMASYEAAQRNVAAIEASTSFDADAENTELNTQIETYNAIILGEKFKLKTRIGATLTKEKTTDSSSTSTTLSKDAAIMSTIEIEEVEEVTREIKEVIEEVAKPTDKTVKPVVKEVTTEIDEAVDNTVTPVVKEVVPIEIPKVMDLGL